MSERTITLHAFCSAKGGVGKSTLAVAAARLLADKGRKVVVIDADLTGTSLADGLRLCAPDVARLLDGHLDFDAAPTGRHLTRDETVKVRNARKDGGEWEGQPPAPPYLNDVLIYDKDEHEARVEALCWKHESDDSGVLYLPSAPFRQDISIALGWLHNEEPFAWLGRLMWLLDGMSEQMETLSDVVIDLPPGLFGFAHEALAMLSNLANATPFPSGFPKWNQGGGITWKGNPLLITTLDHNDLIMALEYALKHAERLPHLQITLNRYAANRELELRETIHEHFGKALQVESRISPAARIDELGPLREIFGVGALRMSDDVRKLRAALRLPKAR
jgi:hypothetical protein